MNNSFIAEWHFMPPAEKLTSKFCEKAIDALWFNTPKYGLLDDKNIDEIKEYASGKFSLEPFKRMYKSKNKGKDKSKLYTNGQNEEELDWHCLPLIVTKLNAAISLIQKIPIEVTVKCLDPLAAKKKDEDLTFLKNKPQLESELQELADQMNIGKVDLGTTKHSSVDFDSSPYGLDLNEPEENDVFVNLLYSLKVEAALETVLQIFWKLSKANQIKLLMIRDHFMYGVSVVDAFPSSMTNLPDLDRVFPGDMILPYSELPDYGDNTFRFREQSLTILEMFNRFGDEICTKERLDEIINNSDTGYWTRNNGKGRLEAANFNRTKVNLVYCEIKSVDYVGILSNPKKSPYESLTTDDAFAGTCKDKIWGQNTYCFWWLKNTGHFFAIERLPYAHRTVGLEAYQNFSSIIYKSQERSAVELSIGENKIAQEAYIKLQHAIRKSQPAGKMIDIRFLRNALSGMSDAQDKFSMMDLIVNAIEENIVIIDTEGFDGKNDGQFKPVVELAGGLKAEIVGYVQTIENSKRNIGQFMGINDQIVGQQIEELVGSQRLAINASLNSISYANEAVEDQVQTIFNGWSYVIKDAVEKGGKSKKAIEDLIGSQKTNIIDGIEDFPAHQMAVEIRIQSRDEERNDIKNDVQVLKQAGVLSIVDQYMLGGIENPKAQREYLAIKVKQFEKRQDKIRQENYAQQQQLVQQQGQNLVQNTQAETEGKIQGIYAKAEAEAKVLTLAKQLGMNEIQAQAYAKKILQDDRNKAQLEKALATLQTKSNLSKQDAFA